MPRCCATTGGYLGRLDRDGYVAIVGRSKDLVISGGFNIYPKEIELVLDDVPGVMESAVIGVPHGDFGEALVGIVVPEPGAEIKEAEVIAEAGANLARFKQPKRIPFLDELPRNAMGKVRKEILRETFCDLFATRG
jgi:malonyl-CoA/methylmalonyl-CoA synthetase